MDISGSLKFVKKNEQWTEQSDIDQVFDSGYANSIGNRLLSYTGIMPEIKLPDRVQLATKLEHFVGSLPLKPYQRKYQ